MEFFAIVGLMLKIVAAGAVTALIVAIVVACFISAMEALDPHMQRLGEWAERKEQEARAVAEQKKAGHLS